MTIKHARLLELVHYDPETGVFTTRVRLRKKRPGDRIGALSGGYLKVEVDSESYLGHRLAWFYVHGYWPEFIDHRDMDRSNCRLSNLRECTTSQNRWNTKKLSNNTSGFKGVNANSRRPGRWIARIMVNGKRINLGSAFRSAEEAAAAYREAADRFHKEFARVD